MQKQPSTCPLCQGQQTVFFFQDNKNAEHLYHRCSNCDLVFVLPDYRLNANEEKARYDMHHNNESLDYINFLSRLGQPMLVHLTENSTGLDFGSGRSQAMANLFRQHGHRCYCYDIFYYPDNTLLTNRYDFIIASEVIEHLYEPKQVIEQWLSMLKPSGLLGIMTGIRPDESQFPNWWYKNDPTHVALFSAKTFEYLAANYSLKPVVQQPNIIIFQAP